MRRREKKDAKGEELSTRTVVLSFIEYPIKK